MTTSASDSSPRAVLSRSRVDLIERIENGLPPREYVPGADRMIPKAKRLHVAAPAKSGKTLVFGIVTAIEIVAAGGIVVILDQENGPDEYARRLDAVLAAGRTDDDFREAVRQRLLYYAWPEICLAWRNDPAYPAEFEGADVVIFDSTRSHTAPLGLNEDASDDWAAFTTTLIDPLMRAGITPVMLDNIGHNGRGRPRGTSAKGDLCDVAYTLKAIRPFSLSLAGLVELRCAASRIGEVTIGDAWQMELGDGHYGSWQRVERAEHSQDAHAAFRPTSIMEKVSRTVEQSAGLSKRAIRAAVTGGNYWIDVALEILVMEGYVEASTDGQAHRHHSIQPYREEAESPILPTVPRPCRSRAAGTVESTVLLCPPPFGGTGTGTKGGHADDGHRAPVAELSTSGPAPDSVTAAVSPDPADGNDLPDAQLQMLIRNDVGMG